jgi:predicted O-methyltransferase YrrM
MKSIFFHTFYLLLILNLGLVPEILAQNQKDQNSLDERVQKYLEENRKNWQDLNVPYEDGELLHNLIVQNDYQSAVEIGTSTGHSTIWIAWALSKTGGKLITIEIDEKRQKEAIEKVKALGLSEYVDFRLGNAHEIVKELEGPFDFVFSDADKDWYVQYFKDLDPKLKKGGRFTAHNVLQSMRGIGEFMDLISNHPDYETTVDRSSSSGTSISLKK